MKFLLFALSLASTTAFGAPVAPAYPKIIDESALKESLDPCDDFYQFACGTWMDQTSIPADKKGIARQSTPMMDSVDTRLNQILSAYAQGNFQIPATYGTKLADFYKSCMAMDANSDAAIKLLRTKIEQIKKIKTDDDVAQWTAGLQLTSTGLFNLYSMQDYNDSSVILADLSQGGMVLTNPSYYVDKDAKAIEIRAKYKEYIARIFTLLGSDADKAKKIATSILRLETNLASKSYSVTDQSDPDKVNHVMDLEAVKKLTPSFHWDVYFKTLGLQASKFNVDEPEFFQNLETF